MRVLFVDDEPEVRKALRLLLKDQADLELFEAATYEQALEIATKEPLDLLLVDIRLSKRPGDRRGLDLVREMKRRGLDSPCVIITSSNQMEDLREAMRLGAKDYVLKDELSAELLVPVLDGFRERAKLRGEVRTLRERTQALFGVGALIGSSKAMEDVRTLVLRVADSDATVLVRGQTGTGKELVARALHQESQRRAEPFVPINCSAVPGNLLESILFGHERGSFTGADRQRRGRFHVAAGGTVLLDEIADMPLDLQAKLLRVLEEGKFLPIGAEREIPLRARIVAATHGDTEALVATGRFRADLLYRLNTVTIHLPSLAERGDDVVELLMAFTASLERPIRYTDDAVRWLARRRWEGNVRELRNAVVRLSLLSPAETIELSDAMRVLEPARVRDAQSTIDRLADEILSLPESSGSRLRQVETTLVRRAMEHAKGNQSEAARLVGIARETLRRRLEQKYPSAIDPNEEDPET